MSDPTSRTLSLLSLLQTHRHWKGSELAVRLSVTQRTIRRDIERLRDLGYPVDASAGVDGGYRLAVGAHVPPLLLDDEEAVALVIGLRAAAVSSIEGVEQTTVQLMAKLDQMLPDRLRRRIDALQSSVEVLWRAPTAETVSTAALTVLSQGCRDREEVRFEYQRRDGEQSSRLVQPHQLMSAGRRWYLVAWDVRRDDWRMFRVDRMAVPRLAGVRFEPRTLPVEDAATFVTNGMRVMTVEHRARVVVAAAPEAIAPVMHWFGAEVVTSENQRTTVDLCAESLDWLASMITIVSVSFDVEIETAPEGVHERLATAIGRLNRQDTL